ncbi:TPA: hypothetical protein KET04_002632 [Enterococcus faecalis]|nr:hypothetical protein [Enterococcus faecalis]
MRINLKMKKISMLGLVVISIISLAACTDSEVTKVDYDKTNNSIVETDSHAKAEFATIAEKQITKNYAIDNFKIDLSSIKVNQFPDEINADTGEVYKNVMNGGGKFTFQDKIYDFSLIYSKKDESKYTVLYLYSPLDKTKTMEIPLKSDQ